jgi:hypothetical protein
MILESSATRLGALSLRGTGLAEGLPVKSKDDAGVRGPGAPGSGPMANHLVRGRGRR